MNKTVYLFVENFSNDKIECFFEKELPFLQSEFSTIKIISLYPENNRELNYKHPNIEVLEFKFFSPYNRIAIFFKYGLSVFKIFFFEWRKSHSKVFYVKHFFQLLNPILLACSVANRFEKLVDLNSSTTLFYSYWFNQWALMLSVLKIKYPMLKFVSRVHGGDYDETQVNRVLPFRYFQFSKVNKILPISEYGKKYLETIFKVSSAKLETHRLGLNETAILGPIDSSVLHLVSCSSLVSLKRVHLIIEILNEINIPWTWTHFGDGPLKQVLALKSKDLKGKVVWKGYVANSEFIKFLEVTPISLFVNVSESEGIPVSMMEAIAKGIPLIGTDICGVPEIVTQNTGYLIPIDFSPKKVAERIGQLHTNQSLYNKDFRTSILQFYAKNFSAKVNYQNFSKALIAV